VAFLAAHNTIYRDGELYREYGRRQVSFPLTLSGDGRTLAWKLSDEMGAGTKIVVNGVEGPLYAATGLPVASDDGNTVAYKASDKEDSWFIIVNGKRISPAYEDVTSPALSGDGRVVTYAAQGDRPLLFVGSERIEIPEVPRSVFLARDGTAWGLVTRKTVVTVQGPGEAFDEIRDPEFSPDGRRVAYGGRQGDRWFVVVGARKVEAPGFIGGPIWSDDGRTVGYGALLGRDVWWKVFGAP
jgi:hypothetical protein